MSTQEKKFATAHTRKLLAGQLNDFERQAVTAIEEHGCFVLSVSSNLPYLEWSYTFGIFDRCKQPEMIVVGLSSGVGHRALNRAADVLRAGVDLAAGRHKEIVGKVEVEFRPVDPEWVKKLMGSAKWFNGSWDFPVLQLIYPDLANKFQWENGFNEDYRQPLLQADVEQTRVEEDFKLSLDPASSFYDWKFPDPPHTSSYLSKTVNDGEETVTYVSHDANGDWQFLGDLMSDGGGPVLSCLHHPIDKDASLKELADLPRGWYAERVSVGEPWKRHEHGPEDEEAGDQ
jgi:hypothetical protein